MQPLLQRTGRLFLSIWGTNSEQVLWSVVAFERWSMLGSHFWRPTTLKALHVSLSDFLSKLATLGPCFPSCSYMNFLRIALSPSPRMGKNSRASYKIFVHHENRQCSRRLLNLERLNTFRNSGA